MSRFSIPQASEWLRRAANDLLNLPRNFKYGRLLHADIRAVQAFFLPGDLPRPKGRTVVFASFLPLPYMAKMEGVLSKALLARGFNPVCVHTDYSRIAGDYHRTAFGNPAFSLARFIPWGRHATLSALTAEIAAGTLEAIKAWRHAGVNVGLHALASASAYNAAGRLDLDRAGRRRIQRLMLRSCLFAEAAEALLRELNPCQVIAVEKGFVECCEIFYAAVNAGVDYVQWHSCHEPESIMLKRYHRGNLRAHPFSISAETWRRTLAEPWRESIAETVYQEFRDGYSEHKWFAYKKLTEANLALSPEELSRRYALDPAKKTAVIFSPILNDANLFYGQDLFSGGFAHWLVETVRVAMTNDRVNWILKLHPANRFRREMSGESGEYGELAAIREALGELPGNLRVMLPEDNVNPYDLFQCIHYGLTVRGTVGAELPCFGVPILTAGTGRYSGLGFTEDSETASAYLDKVSAIDAIPPLTPDQVRLALRHAYLFFKIRPSKYDSFAADVFESDRGSPFFRDLRFKAATYKELLDNPQLKRIVDWLSDSKDEDCLADAAQDVAGRA